LLRLAEEQAAVDPFAERSLLLDAREEFLRAALLKSGDLESARRITSTTRRLRKIEATIEAQRAEQEERQEKLTAIIERLRNLAARQSGLAAQSSQVLRQRRLPFPVDPNENGNYSNDYANEDNTPEEGGNAEEIRAAQAARDEQQAVRKETSGILDRIAFQRETLRQILKRAYGNVGRTPNTELDRGVEVLAAVVDAQDQALGSLGDESLNWPRANTAFHTAAARMEEALESLQALVPPKKAQDDEPPAFRNSGDDVESMEDADSDRRENRPRQVSAGDFREALSLQTLPTPNHTSAEILAEEAANQQQRARRKAIRAGSRVEKNW
jgi:hypothetical protein